MTTPTPSPATASAAAATATRRPRRGRAVLLLLLLAAAVGVGTWVWMHRDREATDDAFVAADVFRINAKVPGRVQRVLVKENETVTAGQLLAELEAADYEARVASAQAAVAVATAALAEAKVDVDLVAAQTASAFAAAQADVAAAEARRQQAEADQVAADTEAQRTTADLERYRQLSEHAVSRERLAEVDAAATAARAVATAARQRLAAAAAALAAEQARLAAADADRGRTQVAAAAVQRREAELAAANAAADTARLDLASTRVTAPVAGRVTRKAVLPGTYVQAGQNLMAVVGTEVWVVANFKETQLVAMRPGQHATVHVDAYGIDLAARVDSIQAGSGVAFSLLPPENATGNYVKVVQRVPVKLVFERQPDPQYVLGPGMSVVPEVTVR